MNGLPIGFKTYIANVDIQHDGGQSLDGGRVVLLVPVKREYGPTEAYTSYLPLPGTASASQTRATSKIRRSSTNLQAQKEPPYLQSS